MRLSRGVIGRGSSLLPETRTHIARVIADGGTVPGKYHLDRLLRAIKAVGINLQTEAIVYSPSGGYKGGATCSKLYEAIDTSGARDLSQATGAAQPALATQNGKTALQFDGTDDYMKSPAFTLNQPETVIMAVKQISWTANRDLFDGSSTSSGIAQQYVSSPDIRTYAGVYGGRTSQLAIGAFSVVTGLFNGAGGYTQVGRNAAVAGDCGTANLGGFTLGARSDGASPSNILTTDIVILKSADVTKAAAVREFLMGAYGL